MPLHLVGLRRLRHVHSLIGNPVALAASVRQADAHIAHDLLLAWDRVGISLNGWSDENRI